MTQRQPATRGDFRRFHPIATRWHDNDAYGHVNNVVYYAFFDTAVNEFLIERGLIDLRGDAPVFYVVETGCRYRRPIAYPDQATVGLRIARLGGSSVRYELAVFRGDEHEASAEGHFVHVLVDRATARPVAIPSRIRSALEELRPIRA